MITAVDTNILLDVLLPNDEYLVASKQLLLEASETGALRICHVVYAELATQFPSRDALDAFLHETGIQVEPFERKSLAAAADTWNAYAEESSKTYHCDQCGGEVHLSCPSCEGSLSFRRRMMPDFLIAGHAREQADQLLTRDLGFYRTYFDDLQVLSPK